MPVNPQLTVANFPPPPNKVGTTGNDAVADVTTPTHSLTVHTWDTGTGEVRLGWQWRQGATLYPFDTLTVGHATGQTLADPDVVINQVASTANNSWKVLLVYTLTPTTGVSRIFTDVYEFTPPTSTASAGTLVRASGQPVQLNSTGAGAESSANVDASYYNPGGATTPASKAVIVYEQVTGTTLSSIYAHAVNNMGNPQPSHSRRLMGGVASALFGQPDVAVTTDPTATASGILDSTWFTVAFLVRTSTQTEWRNIRIRQERFNVLPLTGAPNNTAPVSSQIFARPFQTGSLRAPRIAGPWQLAAARARDFCAVYELELPPTTTPVQPRQWQIRAVQAYGYALAPAFSQATLNGAATACRNTAPVVAYVGDGIRAAWTYHGTGSGGAASGCLKYAGSGATVVGEQVLSCLLPQGDTISLGSTYQQVNDDDAANPVPQNSVAACGRGLRGAEGVYTWLDLGLNAVQTRRAAASATAFRPGSPIRPQTAVFASDEQPEARHREQHVELWPLPASGRLHVRAAAPLAGAELLDVRTGRPVAAWPTLGGQEQAELPVPASLPAGALYALRLTTVGGRVVVRHVVLGQ